MKKFFVGMTAMALLVSAFGINSFAEGSKTVKVDKVQTVGALDEQKGSMIEIRESEKDSWGDSVTFELKLPTNVKWNAKTIVNGHNKPQIDGNSLKITMKTNPKYQEVAYIVPYFDVDKRAEKGDISVIISGGVSGDKDESVVIAKISDYGVNISSSYERAAKNSKSIPVEITVIEAVQDSILPGTPYGLSFDNATVDEKSVKIEQLNGRDKLEVSAVKENYAEFNLTENSSNINKFVIKLNIAPKKDFVGDITATFDGRGIENISSVVAKVYDAINVEDRKPDNITLGLGDQKLTDLSFVETSAGALSEGEYILKLDPEYKGSVFSSVKLEAEGNIKVGSADVKKDTVVFKVNGASTAPSKLTFSDMKITIDRFGYEGEYTISLVNAKTPDDVIAKATLFNVNAVAPETVKTSVSNGIEFVIGSAEYKVTKGGNTEQKTLDVAPYIAKGNRTMLPLRAVAETLDMEVKWDAKTSTATLNSKDNTQTVVLTIGNKTMLVNGKEVALDSAPEIKDARTFLPVAQIANALNVKTAWDAFTKTVTLSK
ncbi:MAG: copper amine oxidase N-terminal domain-containing protein [Peptoanaerobacter stomatis]|uniref:copper amine oxidase N-terminal domain-containing protein n=1 Tax=Peptoanaerobacter stomatis TaxID=796937 RepID=UPI003F9F75D5